MLTEEQVTDFLVHRLKFTDFKSALEGNKVEFLGKLFRHAGVGMFYENVTWAAQKSGEREAPTIENIIKQELETGGGACIQINYFLKLVLDHLGFDAVAVAGQVVSPAITIPRNHIMTVVRLNNDNNKEELYLVDLGYGGRPIPEPVNLSRLPYTYRAGGFDIEYRFNDELKRYERISHLGCPLRGPYQDGITTNLDYFFEMKPEDFSAFDEHMRIVFTEEDASFFLNVALIFRFIHVNSPSDYEFACWRGPVLVRGTAETRSEERFPTYISMLPRIRKIFPELAIEKLQAALTHYDSRRDRYKL